MSNLWPDHNALYDKLLAEATTLRAKVLRDADDLASLRKQLEDAREALVKNQWELETIDRTRSTNFRRVQDLILANRAALKGPSNGKI